VVHVANSVLTKVSWGAAMPANANLSDGGYWPIGIFIMLDC